MNLEQALFEIGRRLDVPDVSLAPAVRARIELPRKRRLLPRLAIAAAAIVLLVTAVLLVSPAARTAVADWLGLRGVRIIRQPTPPPSPTVTQQADLGLKVSLPEAAEQLAIEILLPPQMPDEVYLTSDQVTLLYYPSENFPATSRPGAGMLLTEFRGTEIDYIHKSVGPGTSVEPVAVSGTSGYWLEGDPHVVVFGETGEKRLAGNTLLWVRGELTLRLESALSKEQAVSLAESLQPFRR